MALASMVVCATSDLSAHRRDELLQAARLAIAPDRVELQLDVTPGIERAEAVIARIDRDRDGAFSADEKAAYVADVMSTIVVRIDDRPVGGPSPSADFPDAVALRSGNGTIRLSSTIVLPRIGDGAHSVSFRNDHQPESSVYLVNALVPDGDRIVINRQTRDPEQRTLTIDYTISGEQFATLPVWLFGGGAAMWAALRIRR
jgi:hypothetical protein